MPKSSAFRITSAYIEFLHDRGIALTWPGVEPVGPFDCLDLNLLESVSEQPFQAGYGVEFYPTIFDKAACMFFSIAGGHIFTNGNKRTAVLAVDQFFMANETYLLILNEEMRRIAEATASYRTRNENAKDVMDGLSTRFRADSVPFRLVKKQDAKFHSNLHSLKRWIRNHRLNQGRMRPQQVMEP